MLSGWSGRTVPLRLKRKNTLTMKSTTGNAYINKLELDLLCFTTAVIEYYGEERRKKTVFVIGSEKSATLGFQHDKGVISEKAIGETKKKYDSWREA